MADREFLIDLFHAGLAAADPAAAVRSAVRVRDRRLECGRVRFDLEGSGRLAVIAAGKASPAMATGFVDVVGAPIQGFAVAPHQSAAPLPLLVAGHPLADHESVAAGHRALQLAASLGEDDLLVVLLSGGASALLAAPRHGLEIEEIARITDRLLRAGADISELNTVRRALSRIKGGGLAACTRAAVLTLALSDVVGDDSAVIASGPTVVSPTGAEDARRVLGRHGVRISRAVERALGEEPELGETGTWEYVVVAGGETAAAAVCAASEARGVPAVLADHELRGEARHSVRDALDRARSFSGLSVFCGETTVTVAGDGVGGRNQEAALAAALLIEGSTTSVLTAGTDGIDGPTEAAGAVVDGSSVRRIRAAGVDPGVALQRNDSHSALVASGDVLVTGPTGTNVGDLWLVLDR